MYRELHSLRQALHHELEGTLPPLPGVEPNKLLQTYLDQLTLYVGVDVADQTVTLLALNANKEELGDLLDCPHTPQRHREIGDWLEHLRAEHHLRIIAVACETTGVFYWGLWDYLATCPNVARVLFNPRTTEHMGEVLSKRVRDELVDALLLAEQLRGKTLGEVREILAAFKSMLHGESAPDERLLGDLAVLEGVKSFPVRIKCALLPWTTLEQALAKLRG